MYAGTQEYRLPHKEMLNRRGSRWEIMHVGRQIKRAHDFSAVKQRNNNDITD